ncbi:MAG: hypothetical protein AB7O91_05995 [Sphingomonas sp.]
MSVTILALALAMTPPAGAQAHAGSLRVEAIVVRPPAMPRISRSRHGIRIDNPGAIAISVDDEPPQATASRLIGGPAGGRTIRRITLIF